jgi:hypothetical protein
MDCSIHVQQFAECNIHVESAGQYHNRKEGGPYSNLTPQANNSSFHPSTLPLQLSKQLKKNVK